jgi:SPP1 family predicted phage head-tail adaptor
MKAGRLRHRVDIQTLTIVLDSDGATEETWLSVVPKLIPARIIPLSGRELIAADAVQSKINTRIVIRYIAGIIARMRVVHRGEIFNIESVIPDAKSGTSYLTLNCTSGANEG